ncbi:MAG: hypothetical protein ABIQ40_17175 [Bacteroidia bacterium]
MKRKIKLYIIALVSLGIYFWAGSYKCMSIFLNDWNNEKRPELLKLDNTMYGDLYGLSYLSKYRMEGAGFYAVPDNLPVEKPEGKIYIIGDSYLAKMFLKDTSSNLYKTELAAFYWFGLSEKADPVKLEKGKKNILLIEMSERFVRSRFTSKSRVKSIMETFSTDTRVTKKKVDLLEWRIVPKNIEQNIATLFFGYRMFGSIKETKADFSYYAFNRCDPQVYVSEKQQRLYFSNTIDTLEITSAFSVISEKEVGQIVNNMNAISEHYRKIGFDEVVFTFIPNAASVCSPGTYPYNKLLPEIQSSAELKADFINVYDAFRTSPDPCNLYWKGDTHWNASGYLIWQNLFNEYLKASYNPEEQLSVFPLQK